MLLELAPQEVGVGRFPAEAVPVLSEHYGDAAPGHKVSYAVHAWPLQAGPTLSGVRYLVKELVAFSGGVGSQGLEDSPLLAVAVSGEHDYSPLTRSVGSTPRARASLVSVGGWKFSFFSRLSRSQIVLVLTPDSLDRAR